ncbi:MAG: hypothetical protein R2774_03430 [Saprospiraceae bacterium]
MNLIDLATEIYTEYFSKVSWQFQELMDDITNNPNNWILHYYSDSGYHYNILHKNVAVYEDYVEIWFVTKNGYPTQAGLFNCPKKGIKLGNNLTLKEEKLLEQTIKRYRTFNILTRKSFDENLQKLILLRERLRQNRKQIDDSKLNG